MKESRENWDNLSDGPTFEAKSVREAKQAAEKHNDENTGGDSKEEGIDAIENTEEDGQKIIGDFTDENSIGEGGQNNESAEDQISGDERSEDINESKGAGSEDSETELPDDSGLKQKQFARRSEGEEEKDLALEAAEESAWESVQQCRELCQMRQDCFQYIYYDKTCKLGRSFRLGKHASPSADGNIVYTSGWMVDRIHKWTEANVCTKPEWPEI